MPSFRVSLIVSAVAVLALGVLIASHHRQPISTTVQPVLEPAPDDSGVVHLGMSAEQARVLGGKIEPLHIGKGTAHPGDWLASQSEDGQSFAEYVRQNPNRPTSQRNVLYVVPVGDFSPAQQPLFDAAAEALGIFYGVQVKRLDEISPALIGPDARRINAGTHAEQFLTSAILELLINRRPDDAVAVIALTPTDLWPGNGWNFVFGQASIAARVGVWSLSRLGDPKKDAARVMRRTVQVALHETGHILGIQHCTAYACGMNGSNGLSESDRNPIHFCPEDEMKVWWACRVDPVTRYRTLAAFAQAHGIETEAKFWEQSADALSK